MGSLKTIFIIIGIIILGLIAISIGVALYKNTTVPVQNAPQITLDNTIINTTVGVPIFINGSITDDGVITSAIWSQVAGPNSNFTQVDYDLYFTPQINGTYIFKLEAQDDQQLINEVGVQVTAKLNVTKPSIECEPDERIVDGKCVEIPKPTCNSNQYYNATDNTCRTKPTPPPVPTPTPPVGKDIKVIMVGDVEDSTSGKAVFEQIKKQNATYEFILGDLGYDSSLSWFKSTYGTLGDSMFCVIGNHEANNEDGSSAIEKETLEFCGNSYWIKNGVTLFLMMNTNDNQDTLITAFDKVLTNSTIMNGVKNIHVNGHKGCATPPNSHHDAGEIQKLCDYIKSKIPSTIKVFYNSAHNHLYSESADKTYKQVGTGGKSHYTCGTNAQFPYCNNVNYGFLLYTIKADGTTTSQFIDYNGKVIH
jgi:hypothetical protein